MSPLDKQIVVYERDWNSLVEECTKLRFAIEVKSAMIDDLKNQIEIRDARPRSWRESLRRPV